ncbi:MAG: hypothetical protein IPN66_09180 [Candidatus Competibacteraceae bacterium]|nr:hypothetical protein [Candidatus Competibacteraceae bacterium]
MDDDPDSLRTYDEEPRATELREMRRTADRSREEQIYLLTGSVGAIKVDIADLKRALADHVGPGEEAQPGRHAGAGAWFSATPGGRRERPGRLAVVPRRSPVRAVVPPRRKRHDRRADRHRTLPLWARSGTPWPTPGA